MLLSCPVLCGTGIAACCDNDPVNCHASQGNGESLHCCHDVAESTSSYDEAGDATDPVEPSGQNEGRPGNCLCDGAVAASEDIAQAMMISGCPLIAALSLVEPDVVGQSIRSARPPFRPRSGLAMRIEQMSLLL
jgi:hypothetical protein